MAKRQAEHYLDLQPSETAIVHAASRILAALIAAGKLTDQNAAELVRWSAKVATALGVEVDALLDSDDESGGGRGRLGPLG
jgi:hypothetical protein